MSEVLHLTNDSFDQEVLKSDIPVLVDFWAPWCGPCQMMGPILDDLVKEVGDRVKVTKLDVENPQHQILATKYQISSIPSLKVFKDGQVVKELIGLRSKDQLIQDLSEFL